MERYKKPMEEPETDPQAEKKAVDAHKRKKIILTATQYLRQRRLDDCFCRFDVIEVYAIPTAPWRIRHYEGAFEM